MSHHRPWGVVLVALTTLLTVSGLSQPARADGAQYRDGRKDVEHFSGRTQETTYGGAGLDIYWTRVRYVDGKLIIRTRFHDLTRCNTELLNRCRPWSPEQQVKLDTTPDPADEPYQEEYYAVYLDHHVSFSTDTQARTCTGLRWRSNLNRETSTFVVPRSCLRRGDRRRVRVRVEAYNHGKGYPSGYGDLVFDEVGWTPWVTYG